MRPTLATLLSLPALLLACNLATAADYQTVVTAYLIRDTLATSQNGGSQHALRANPGLGLGLAFDGGGSERLSLDYTDFDLGNNNSLQLLNLNLDHFFPAPGLPPAARLFVGGVAGIGRLDLTGEPGGKTATHGSLGLRLGGLWRLSPQLSLELGGRYLHTGLSARFSGGELAVNADTAVWLGLGWHLN
jgi:hypothetical protein